MNKALLIIILPMLSTPIIASNTYTAQQLNQMIDMGRYPLPGKTVEVQNKSIIFSDCKVAVDKIMSEFNQDYPIKTIVSTSVIYMAKAWKNDGVVVATCSEPETTMELFRALYQ